MCEIGVQQTTCMPYKDPCIITAQVFTGVACGILCLFMFFGGYIIRLCAPPGDGAIELTFWVSVLLALTTFIMGMCGCCCAYNKGAIIAMAVLSLVWGIIVMSTGIAYMGEVSTVYWPYYLPYAAAIVSITAGVLFFTFACSNRLQTAIDKLPVRAEDMV
jgi:hypothetical protein